MLFGFRRRTVVVALAELRSEIAGLREDVRGSQREVKHMSDLEQQVETDIAAIKAQFAAYQAAGASRVDAAVAAAKTEWQKAADADKDAIFTKLHTELTDVSASMASGQPITPAPTDANPSPAPVSPPDAPAA